MSNDVSHNPIFLRAVTLGVTGLVCVVYAAMAWASKSPDPMPFWIPGALGVLSAVVYFVATRLAGPDKAGQAMDEGYDRDLQTAYRIGYWAALLLYPAFGLLLANRLISFDVAYAVMSTLTGATFLLSFVWLDFRGRA